MQNSEFVLVNKKALPPVFAGVLLAKQLLAEGKAANATQAIREAGISRSAFYKYRDTIAPFQNMMAGRIITFQMMLKDKAGVLSAILSIFANCGANILTINQSIPTGGRAMATISAETGKLECPLEELSSRLSSVPGVVRAEVVAG